mgnify:CR=1 FL=1
MATTAEQSRIQDRVNSICNELYAKGTKPSVRLVLSMLPDVSSTSTVHKYFANWRRELEANQQSLYDKLGFSSEFTQSFMKEITRFSVEAEQRYKELAQDANEQRDLALDDLTLSEERLYKQNAVLEQLEHNLAEINKELTAVKADAKSELQKTVELSRAALEKEKETHAAVVAELRQQLAHANATVKSLTETNEGQRTELAKANLKLEGNQKYVDEVKAQNADLVSENKALSKELTNVNRTLAGQDATIAGNNKLISNLEETAKENLKALSAGDKERAALSEANQRISQELSSVTRSLAAANENLERSNATVSELRKIIDEQSTVIAKLTS